ncbi:MAG: DUF4440 domain-containing protein [Chitinophagaceae bacterium]
MKKTLFSIVALASFSLFFVSCNSESEKKEKTEAGETFNLDSAKAAVNASNLVYGACFATGDSAKFIGCYTADACINPPNTPRMCGPAAITGFFNAAYKMGIRNIKATSEEVSGCNDMLIEIGKYELLGDKDVSFDKGKYIVIWKQENGKWKMHKDEWNSDNPPPPPPPAPAK